MSQPYIRNSTLANNRDIYFKECIKKRLIPYIRANYQGNYIFWSDLANFHYAEKLVDYLHEETINLVEKLATHLMF